jgi:hypothetical protein
MATLNVRPNTYPGRENLLVRNPDNAMQPLAKAGETVPDTAYWRRRLKDGDVVEVKAAESKPAPAHTHAKK